MICSNAPGGFSFAAWRPIYRMRRNSSADASSDPSSRNFGQLEWFAHVAYVQTTEFVWNSIGCGYNPMNSSTVRTKW